MIIEALLSTLYKIFELLTTPINIPQLPDSIHEYLDMAMSYIQAGVGIVANYTNLDYLLVLFGILLAIDVGVALYHFVMWILKKIPMLSVR